MKIAFVGASGYGNVGDNTYPFVFSKHLPEHELLFFNSDLPKEMPADLDLLVFGGGGILYNNPSGEDLSALSPHFCQMRYYLKWAVETGVPFGFSSCGFQFRAGTEELFREVLKPWIPYFDQARFITLRSPNCVRIMQELAPDSEPWFYPDAGYLMAQLVEVDSCWENMLTVAVAGKMFPGDPLCKRFMQFLGSMKYETVWMSMGAPVDDAPNLSFARRRFPGTRVIEAPTPEEAYRQIARSRLVLSGRYHGMVFARAAGVPFYFPEDVPYKLRHEDFQAEPAEAMGHITVLREAIARLAPARGRELAPTEPAMS
jgi:hypothetical protein